MISLHSILAVKSILSKLPLLAAIFAGFVLAVAFTVGFVKGFRKVSWGGITWLTAGAAFLLACRFISMEGTVTKKFVLSLGIALGCIAAVLAGYGVLAYFLRPKIRWVKDDVNGDTSLAEYGLEFEPEYLDYDGEDDWQPYGKRIHKTGFNPPNFVGRLLGGTTCLINTAMVLWAMASAVLLAITALNVSNASLKTLLDNGIVAKLAKFSGYALLDMLSLGVVIVIAKKGYTNGWLNSLRVIIIALGTLGGIVGCFYLPWAPAMSNPDKWGFLINFVNKCINVCSKAGKLATPLGKLVAGGCMSCGVIAVMIALNIVLKKCCRFVSATAPTRAVDMVLSCVLYMIIGAIICVGGWFMIAAVDFVGIFNFSEVIGEKAHLSNGLFNFAEAVVRKLLGSHFGG